MVFCFNCGTEILKSESNYCQNCGYLIYEFTKSSDSSSSSSDKIYSYPIKRLDDQIKWHSQKARNNKKKFRIYQIITIIASALIPIINITGPGFADIQNKDCIFGDWRFNSNNHKYNTIRKISRELDTL